MDVRSYAHERLWWTIVVSIVTAVTVAHWCTRHGHDYMHAIYVSLRKLYVLPVVLAAIAEKSCGSTNAIHSKVMMLPVALLHCRTAYRSSAAPQFISPSYRQRVRNNWDGQVPTRSVVTRLNPPGDKPARR